MNAVVPARRTLVSVAAVAALLLVPFPGAVVHAASVLWTGSGTSGAWSDALNWSAQAIPSDGDDVVFSGAPARTVSVIDMLRTLNSLTFSDSAPLFVTSVPGNGSQLAFSGAGIRSLGRQGSVIGRQAFFAEAGSTGATILFTNASGINVNSDQFARPVDITAQGGAVAGSIGGHIVFRDASTTSATTFDAVRASGASVAGASGGEIIFRDNAVLTRIASVVVGGGTSGAAPGGQANFLGQAQLAGGSSILAGQSGGLGGRLDFSGNAIALGTSSIYAAGGGSALAGSEAIASFRGDAISIGPAYLGAGSVAGAGGGRIDFFDRASHDTTSFPASSGTLGIYNVGATAPGAGGGALVFHDDSTVRGAHLFISNQTAEFTAPGSFAGSTSFLDRSRAGQVQIENAGTGGAGAVGGATYFRGLANAENATIISKGGFADSATGGFTQFSDDASAGSAQLRNAGGDAAGALGGTLRFSGRSSAASATIVNEAAVTLGAFNGGVTTFAGSAGAGNATISNETSLSSTAGGRGRTQFEDSASAQNATIDNQGSGFVLQNGGVTLFVGSSSAGNARLTNFGARAAGATGGSVVFTNQATAGGASIVIAGGGVSGAAGGSVQFAADSSAGGATLDLRGASVLGASGGTALFNDRTSAGNAQVTVAGSQVNGFGGSEGAIVRFDGSASAAHASFVIGGDLFAFGDVGHVLFNGASTAADASFATLAGAYSGGKLGFEGTATSVASAGNARIVNGSRATASGTPGFGGATIFLAHSTADRASITNVAGLTAFGAQTVFRIDSSAADSHIVNSGGTAGATGGITFFVDNAHAGHAVIFNQAGASNAIGRTHFSNASSAAQAMITGAGASVNGASGGSISFTDTSTAASATLVAEGGSNGGGGGRIEFQRQATGGIARVVLGAGSTAATGGVLDISGVDVWLPVGSIEGGGNVALGARSLIVVGNGLATTFSGVISGSAPPVFPSLTVHGGSLTLTGANVYAGRTSIGDGLYANSGKLVAANTSGSATGSGAVLIERGGTLAGSGFIAGPVTLLAGGTIAPGDPVTLTLQDSLVWDGGGVIQLVIGADDAGSDHLIVHRLVRGNPGSYTFQFVDAGFVAGQSYALLQFDELVGFAAEDFSFAGLAGSFSLAGGTLGFTAAAVPEPGAATLFAAGVLALWCLRRRSVRAALR